MDPGLGFLRANKHKKKLPEWSEEELASCAFIWGLGLYMIGKACFQGFQMACEGPAPRVNEGL